MFIHEINHSILLSSLSPYHVFLRVSSGLIRELSSARVYITPFLRKYLAWLTRRGASWLALLLRLSGAQDEQVLVAREEVGDALALRDGQGRFAGAQEPLDMYLLVVQLAGLLRCRRPTTGERGSIRPTASAVHWSSG